MGKISVVRNRDGDSEYQMKVAELLLVAQYYGALRLGSGSAMEELIRMTHKKLR